MANIPATASRRTYREGAEFTTPDPVVVKGSFETETGTVVTNVRGEGFSADHSGTTGVYQVTFATPYPMLIDIQVTAQATADDTLVDIGAQAGTYDSATGILQILTHDLDTPALADFDGPRINFTATFHKRNALSVTYTA